MNFQTEVIISNVTDKIQKMSTVDQLKTIGSFCDEKSNQLNETIFKCQNGKVEKNPYFSSVENLSRQILVQKNPNIETSKIQPEKRKKQKNVLTVRNYRNKSYLLMQNLEKDFIKFFNEQRMVSQCRDPRRFKEFFVQRSLFQGDKSNFQIDLSLLSLLEIVALAKRKNIVSNEVQKTFQLEYFQHTEESFVSMLTSQMGQKTNLYKYNLTPIDHRMLSFTLTKLFPKQFSNSHRPFNFSQNVTIFYKFLYSMSQKQYWHLYQSFNHRYSRNWLPTHPLLLYSIKEIKQQENQGVSQLQNYLIIQYDRILRKKI